MAANIIMELHSDNGKRDLYTAQLRYASIEFTLQVYKVLELLGIISNESHPSSEYRINNIRQEMKKRFNNNSEWLNFASVAFGIESIFNDIASIIINPKERSDFYDKEAQKIATELNDLLNKCVGKALPDYTQFYDDIGKVLNKGYPHKILDIVADISSTFFDDINSLSIDPERFDVSWACFQKHKLLLGYVTSFMKEPAKSKFEEVLRF